MCRNGLYLFKGRIRFGSVSQPLVLGRLQGVPSRVRPDHCPLLEPPRVTQTLFRVTPTLGGPRDRDMTKRGPSGSGPSSWCFHFSLLNLGRGPGPPPITLVHSAQVKDPTRPRPLDHHSGAKVVSDYEVGPLRPGGVETILRLRSSQGRSRWGTPSEVGIEVGPGGGIV